MTSANQLSERTGEAGQRAGAHGGTLAGLADPQRTSMTTASHSLPHHTRLTPAPLLARALRLGKYPLSKDLWGKVTRQVIIY